jgi:hypothetical protein
MFLATALLYPCVLAALCVGSGLLVERASGAALSLALLIPVGAAGLIALSQLSTFVYPLAPATPYLMIAVALAGLGLGRRRALAHFRALRAHLWAIVVALLAYALALAPVLAAGRPSFSSYMALADSAVHVVGADFLIRHGQHFAHLDLRNSYGQFLNSYYNASYPSGADTLFGGSALLLGLPLIWAFQPFNAFMLASAAGPAWLIARRAGLTGAWAALAALAAVLPALVYAYELLGSVKEITVLPLILSLGVLVAQHRSWLTGGAARVLPFAILVAGGVSALGIAFGVWALVAALVPALVLARGSGGGGGERVLEAARLAGVGLGVLALAALPTWSRLGGSVTVAQSIAATSNPGNLHSPLRASQALGVWLGGSYKLAPHGLALSLTQALIGLALAAALLGVWQLLRTRSLALAGWFALSLLAWLAIATSASTWAGAKALMLTSPVVVLLAWSGVAALRSLPLRALSWGLAAAVALALAGGALVSDALQYRSANLAPTARYDELASLGERFAGQGPTLFTDFDEYSLYELRRLDVGGPDFVYPPPALAALAGGYGEPVRLDRASPTALAAYRLIVTRRDPAAARPPAAYALVWQGAYYQVWRRRPGAGPALRHLALGGGSASAQCHRIDLLAALAARRPGLAATRLLAAEEPLLVRVRPSGARHPRDWGRERGALVMNHKGTLSATLRVPFAGRWKLWLRGQLMPAVTLGLDGRAIARIGGELSGNSLVMNVAPPIALRLSAGRHRLTLTRDAPTLAPGDGGAAVIEEILLVPAGARQTLRAVPSRRWRSLCGRVYAWVELARG